MHEAKINEIVNSVNGFIAEVESMNAKVEGFVGDVRRLLSKELRHDREMLLPGHWVNGEFIHDGKKKK
jgi:hypothetical protein